MSAGEVTAFASRFPHVDFVQTYGMTEAGPRITTWRSQCDRHKPGSVGRPLAGIQLQILRDGQAAESGAVGEVVVRSPTLMVGYFGASEESAPISREQGLHTGDLGYLDPDGYLYLVGRLKNIIISGGINVAPEELEQLILTVPDVMNCRVQGESHPLLGERIIALITASSPSEELKSAVLQKCHEVLAPHKRPHEVRFVDQLTLTVNGKISRRSSGG